jgi:hypothetical protein
MSLPKRPLFDPQSKIAKPHQSGSHPLVRPAAASPQGIARPMRVAARQSRADLTRHDLEEYARSQAGGAAGANPGPGLLEKVSDGIKGLLKKLTKTPLGTQFARGGCRTPIFGEPSGAFETFPVLPAL